MALRVYRSMQEDAGRPKRDHSAKAPGVRFEGLKVDIHARANGAVESEKKELSVAPLPEHLPSPEHLPTRRVYQNLRQMVEGSALKEAMLPIRRMGGGLFLRSDIISGLLLASDPARDSSVEQGVW